MFAGKPTITGNVQNGSEPNWQHSQVQTSISSYAPKFSLSTDQTMKVPEELFDYMLNCTTGGDLVGCRKRKVSSLFRVASEGPCKGQK